jgi:NTE family protein
MEHAKKIGLALGSGSARGWAHIGVIRSLQEAGIRIDCIAGTSIGALVGAAYALNKMDVLEDFVQQLDWKQIVSFLDVTFPTSGIIEGEKIANFFRGHVQKKTIEELTVDYCAVATDLLSGGEVILRQGDLVEAIRASISVPGIFTPVRINGDILIDGGLVNPVPVSAVRKMGADYVIGVDLNHDIVSERGPRLVDKEKLRTQGDMTDNSILAYWKLTEEQSKKIPTPGSPTLVKMRNWMTRDPLPNLFEVLITSLNIMQAQITSTKLITDPPDLLIQPQLGHIRLLEFHRAQEAITAGYRETKAKIKALTSER